MKKHKNRYKIENDKNTNQFTKTGWCLKEKGVTCIGNCEKCTLLKYPELNNEEEETMYEEGY